MQKVCTMTTKDAYILLESAHFLKDDDLVQPVTPEDTETRRRIIDFVHEIDTARFMLAMSFKDPYLDLVEEKDWCKAVALYCRSNLLYFVCYGTGAASSYFLRSARQSGFKAY